MNNFNIPESAIAYQVFKHPGSASNGVPYSLALVYDNGGEVVLAVKENSGSPNFLKALRPLPQLPSFDLTVREFNVTVDAFSGLVVDN